MLILTRNLPGLVPVPNQVSESSCSGELWNLTSVSHSACLWEGSLESWKQVFLQDSDVCSHSHPDQHKPLTTEDSVLQTLVVVSVPTHGVLDTKRMVPHIPHYPTHALGEIKTFQ